MPPPFPTSLSSDLHDFGLSLPPGGVRIEAVGLRRRAVLVLIGEQYVDRAAFYQGSEVVPVTVHAKAVREREGDLASSVPGGLDRNAHSGARCFGVPQIALQIQDRRRSEEHTSELQSLMRISYAVFCLKKKTTV